MPTDERKAKIREIVVNAQRQMATYMLGSCKREDLDFATDGAVAEIEAIIARASTDAVIREMLHAADAAEGE
jgi:hypothetical protein